MIDIQSAFSLKVWTKRQHSLATKFLIKRGLQHGKIYLDICFNNIPTDLNVLKTP